MLNRIPRPVLGDVTGALGDLGTLLPLAAGMILLAGVDPGAFFVTFGLASLLTGVAFRLPLPVQPQKAIAAAAIGQAPASATPARFVVPHTAPPEWGARVVAWGEAA